MEEYVSVNKTDYIKLLVKDYLRVKGCALKGKSLVRALEDFTSSSQFGEIASFKRLEFKSPHKDLSVNAESNGELMECFVFVNDSKESNGEPQCKVSLKRFKKNYPLTPAENKNDMSNN